MSSQHNKLNLNNRIENEQNLTNQMTRGINNKFINFMKQEKKNEINHRENERRRELQRRKQIEELNKFKLKKERENEEMYEEQLVEFAIYESLENMKMEEKKNNFIKR